VRDPIREIDGLLPNPNIYTQRTDRHHLVGELLAEQKCHPRQSRTWRHHRVDHDHAHVLHQRRAAQDILRQVHRRVLGNVFRDGFRFAIG